MLFEESLWKVTRSGKIQMAISQLNLIEKTFTKPSFNWCDVSCFL